MFDMKTREQIHNELQRCIEGKINELNEATGLCVSSLHIDMLDVTTPMDASKKYIPARVDITYE